MGTMKTDDYGREALSITTKIVKVNTSLPPRKRRRTRSDP
jgi:hypothetical protein